MGIKTSDKNVPYVPNSIVKTEDNSDRYETGSTKGNLKDDIATAFSKMPIAKLFVILLMIVYAVIAYSKKELGVKPDDVSMLIFFAVFVVLVFLLLAVSSHIYRRYLKFFIINDTELSIVKIVCAFFIKKVFLIFVIVALIFIYLLFKSNSIIFLDKIIRWFGGL